MIDPILVIVVSSAAAASAIAVSVACVVTASRTGVILNVALEMLELMELDRQRLNRIRKMRRIIQTLDGQRYSHNGNGATPPALYTPRYDQGDRQ